MDDEILNGLGDTGSVDDEEEGLSEDGEELPKKVIGEEEEEPEGDV